MSAAKQVIEILDDLLAKAKADDGSYSWAYGPLSETLAKVSELQEFIHIDVMSQRVREVPVIGIADPVVEPAEQVAVTADIKSLPVEEPAPEPPVEGQPEVPEPAAEPSGEPDKTVDEKPAAGKPKKTK
jgi:hypothetical protein